MPYYCPNCGVSNVDTVAACYNCGAPNPSALTTDATPPAATNPFEAPTQPQPQPTSPYQAPSYPPPISPGAYGMPPTTPYQYPQYPPPTPMATYAPPAYGPVGYQDAMLLAESGRLQSQARTALILGIVGLLCCGLLGPVAIGFGIQAKGKLQQIGVTEGQSMALVGIILGGIATAMWLFGMVVNLLSR